MAAGDVEVNLTSPIAKQGALFDGVDDKVTVTDEETIQDIWDSGGSLSVWIYPRSDGGANQGRILEKKHLFYVTEESAGACNLKLETTWSSDKGIWTTTGRPVTINAWNHIVLCYDSDAVGNDPIIYVNGTASTITENTTPTGTRTSDAAVDLNIGNNPAESRTFDGTIGGYKLWKRCLTATEASQEAGNTSVVDGLIFHLPLTSDYDDAVGSNDGTNSGSRLGLFDSEVTDAISESRTTANDKYMIASLPGGQVMTTIIEEA